MKQVLTQEELDRFLADTAPTWAYDIRAQRMLWANKPALKFWTAQSAEEFVSRDYSKDSRAVVERLEQVMNATKAGTWTSQSWTLFPKDIPTTVLLNARAYNINGSDHAIVFRIAAYLDMAATDPDGLRMLVSARTTSVAASFFDLHGMMLSENPAALALRQKNSDWGASALCLRQRYHSTELADRILRAIREDSIEAFEFTLPNNDGARVLAVTAKRVRDPVTGEPVAHITEEDVTEKVNLSQSLLTLNNELETRVAARTAELEMLNDKLRQAQKLEILGKLTGGVAHDFNNMLAVIQGNAELMRMTGTYEDDLISEITNATARGADLTRALLAYARKQPLNAKPVDLRVILRDLQDVLHRTLGESIKLTISAPPDLWRAFIDESQISDVVMNLALNARDAMRSGGVLDIRLKNRSVTDQLTGESALEIDGDFVEIAITDTGTGMPKEVLAKATDPFFTTKGVGEGSGLGLSMVYGFARQSSGNMTITSHVGQGTTVQVYLPRHRDDHPDSHTETLGHDGLPLGQGEHIVLVEDDEALRRLMLRSFKSLGYRVSDFRVAHDALKFLRNSPTADLLLTDIILPDGMSGNELGRVVKSEFPDVKILFMSGYPDGIQMDGQGFGPDDVLLKKPIKYEVLAKTIRETLETRPRPFTA